MERRTNKGKNKPTRNNHTIMKTKKIKKIIMTIIKILKWLSTLLSKK